jgi:hypothetical protein
MIQLFYNSGSVMWPVGPQTGNVSSSSLDKDARLSSWLPGVDVAGAWNGTRGRFCFIWLYLFAKPSHVGVDVDKLAYLLHRPMVYG